MSSNKLERTEIVESEEHVIHSLIHFIEEKSLSAIAERDRFVIGLSGTFHFTLISVTSPNTPVACLNKTLVNQYSVNI